METIENQTFGRNSGIKLDRTDKLLDSWQLGGKVNLLFNFMEKNLSD